nr:hypothetical protein [uncultured Pseudomonas sp.]
MNLFMTELASWPTLVRWAIIMPPLPMLVIGLAIEYHIACSRHFPVMCRSFGRSPLLVSEMSASSTLTAGSRVLIVAGMTAAIMWPGFFVRRGQLHPDDSIQFPPYLKRRMQIAMRLILTGLAWAVAVVTFVNLER